MKREYKATHQKLSKKLRQKGYDGIMTVGLHRDKPIDTREIVALTLGVCKVERTKR